MAMRIAVMIPNRGQDRQRFLEHCKYLLRQQTIKPDQILWLDYVPESDEVDITQRYRRGYDRLRGYNFDVIFMWESDDWYSPTYIETMLREWESAGRPEIFGPRTTEYYNLKIFEHFTMHHESRTSAMNTLIRADLNFTWPPDNEPYLDAWLWEGAQPRLRGQLFTPSVPICLGIKHGDGMTGGNMHVDGLGHYHKHGQKDKDGSWLRSIVDLKSFEFYWNYFKKNSLKTA